MFKELSEQEYLSITGGDAETEQEYYDMGYEVGNAAKHILNIAKYVTTPYLAYRVGKMNIDNLKTLMD